MRERVTIHIGICRHCGCSESNPCRLYCGEECCWTDRARNVCTNPVCVNAEAARKRSIALSRPRRLTPAEMHDLIRGRGRKRSCKAARPLSVCRKENREIR
jgi:hypothetical protein